MHEVLPPISRRGDEHRYIINIDIVGQMDIWSRVRISRIMPALLTKFMSRSEWKALRDQFDSALAPIELSKARIRRMTRISHTFAIFASFIIPFALVASELVVESMVAFIAIAAMLGILSIISGNVIYSRIKKIASDTEVIIKEDLQRTLEIESAKRSDISFHLKTKEALRIHKSSGKLKLQTYYYIEALAVGPLISMGVPILAHVVADPVKSTFCFEAMKNGNELGNAQEGKNSAESYHELV